MAAKANEAVAKVRAFEVDGGKTVLVEVHDITRSGTRGRRDIAEGKRLKKKFDEAWAEIRPAIKAIVEQLDNIAPDEAELKFGVKISGECDAVIASASAEANFEVTLTWKCGSKSARK